MADLRAWRRNKVHYFLDRVIIRLGIVTEKIRRNMIKEAVKEVTIDFLKGQREQIDNSIKELELARQVILHSSYIDINLCGLDNTRISLYKAKDCINQKIGQITV